MSKKILMVVTSCNSLGDTGRQTGLWLEEFTTPYYIFCDNGYKVEVASPKGGEVPIDPSSLEKQNLSESCYRYAKDPYKILDTTLKLSEVNEENYIGIFYPGGHGPMFDLAIDSENGALVSKFFNKGKPVAAVCHGPASLIMGKDSNGNPIVANKKVTGFSDAEENAVGLENVVPFLLEDKLKSLGGIYSCGALWQPYVQVDENLVTGQNPASADLTAKEFLKLFE
jgi:putative intracellular protease/amidase